ncbi:hydrogenase [Azospirillum baldaniorum]|uniref:Protein involved in biosynthesis of iron-molybdenum cofactor of nitrogenase n=1 Tax=Azospirillum baldaniorum TaxID=1064539 RepID=A0A9P1NLG7_9PROT|nr:nitrogen fixation protein NifQ [Azospirillum baldaniorum]AWJ90300.1 hydrogenase [Azospirillum baldaniorum]TWA77141.1 nitrogen fixation protein NifQ [Azospirillum brasilense]CCC97601.1 protein involved in biosynthesis of iron-molybdenum cofactor of nitrogenase [Azospirillum baldaniorum]
MIADIADPAVFSLHPPADALDGVPDGPALDRLLFSRIVGLAAQHPGGVTASLGLAREALAELIRRHAVGFVHLLPTLPDYSGVDAIEEEDLRAFLLNHRAAGMVEEEWLAAIVARRTLGPNHLWQDMGFANRRELNAMFRRHFPSLVALNSGDMKWKKFFYRQLCEREGLMLCKSPNCEVCDDFSACFSAEDGDPLSALARVARGEGA